MKTFSFHDNEIDVIRYALGLLKKDCLLELDIFTGTRNLDKVSDVIDKISTIDFLIYKIKF